MVADTNRMKQIIQQDIILKPLRIGEIVEGTMITRGRASVFLDLGAWGTGIIYGREFYDAKNALKDLKIGDRVFTKIVESENEEGYIELSLTKAGRDLAWKKLKESKENHETISVSIVGANKGGLLAEVSGIPAFLPASQLAPIHYPKVEGGDNQKILRALQKFVGKEFSVKIFALDQKEEKLILSEKAKENEKIKELIKQYQVGDIVEGKITGIVDFGAFVKFPAREASPVRSASRNDTGGHSDADESDTLPSEEETAAASSLEGLIHISELDWQLIENPSEIVQMSETVKAKIIDISQDKIFLSLKALKKDPWEHIDKKYKKGDIIKGKTSKFNTFGAFVQVELKIQGLCHISEFGSQKKMEERLELGKEYNFKILSLEPQEHRMSLQLIEQE